MPVKRRAPGQRLRRSRRRMELEQVQRLDPEKYEELVELRRVSPQLFRKELARMIKKGVIVKGRTFVLHEDDLQVLELPDLPSIRACIESRIEEGRYDFRRVGGLVQQERQTRARPDLMTYLQDTYQRLMDEAGRQDH